MATIALLVALACVTTADAASSGSIGARVTPDPLVVRIHVPAGTVPAGVWVPVTIEVTDLSATRLDHASYGISADRRSLSIRGPVAGPPTIRPRGSARALFFICARSAGLYILVGSVRATTVSGVRIEASSGGEVLAVAGRPRGPCR